MKRTVRASSLTNQKRDNNTPVCASSYSNHQHRNTDREIEIICRTACTKACRYCNVPEKITQGHHQIAGEKCYNSGRQSTGPQPTCCIIHRRASSQECVTTYEGPHRENE